MEQSIGDNTNLLHSHLDWLARKHVSITYPDWPHVPASVKNAIWEDVLVSIPRK